jgi:hypothetical protein
MLHNPNWDKPSLTGFKAWLEKQPQERSFDYGDSCECAVGQYLKSIGMRWYDHNSKADDLNMYASIASTRANIQHRPVTFGDVLAVIGTNAV